MHHRNTIIASAAVMMRWLVTVKVPGIIPIMFANRMKENSVKTRGKNFIPSLPAELRNVSATNS